MICSVILAAGESRRMGQPKLLLPFGEKNIIQTVVTNIVSSDINKTLVVVGSDKEKIEETIRDYPVKIVFNRDYRKGMLHSVHCGLKALPAETRAVIVALGDQPAISTDIVNILIEAYRRTEKGIVLPVYKKDRGHPVLIDMKYKSEIEALSDDVGLRGTVYGHQEDTLEVEVNRPGILDDIDDNDDYRRELEKIKWTE